MNEPLQCDIDSREGHLKRLFLQKRRLWNGQLGKKSRIQMRAFCIALLYAKFQSENLLEPWHRLAKTDKENSWAKVLFGNLGDGKAPPQWINEIIAALNVSSGPLRCYRRDNRYIVDYNSYDTKVTQGIWNIRNLQIHSVTNPRGRTLSRGRAF